MHCLESREAAEDLAQTVFLDLARSTPARLAVRGGFDPWFRTVVLNAVRNVARARERRARHEDAARERRPRWSEPVGEQEVLRSEVEARLRVLPADLRFAVTLRYLEDRSHREVAEVLGWPQGTASTRIRRGLEELRGSLAGAGVVLPLPDIEALLRAPDETSLPPAPAGKELLARAAAARRPVAPLLAALALAVPLTAMALFALAPGGEEAGVGDPASDPQGAGAPVAVASDADGVIAQADGGPVAAADDADGVITRQGGAPAGGPRLPGGDTASGAGRDGLRGRTDEPRRASKATTLLGGRVLDERTRAPLAGAEVYAFRRLGGRLVIGSEGQLRDAVTGADGAFELPLGRVVTLDSHGARVEWLEETPVDMLDLVVRAPGHVPLVQRFTLEALTRRPDVVLREGAGSALRGVVVDESTHLPVPDVALRLWHAVTERGAVVGTLVTDTRADARGRFALTGLTEGEGRIGPVPGQGLAGRAVPTHPADPAQDVVVPVAREAELTVQVDGLGPARADGLALDVEARTRLKELPAVAVRVEAVDVDAEERPIWDVSIDSNGRGGLGSLTAGTFRILVHYVRDAAVERARAGDLALRQWAFVDQVQTITLVAGERRTVGFQAPRAEAWCELTCRVVDGVGAPCAGLALRLRRAELPLWEWDRTLRAATNEQGQATFVALVPGRYEVGVEDDEEPPALVTLQGGRATLELVHVRPVELAGRVVDAAGRPIASAQVQGDPVGEDGSFRVARVARDDEVAVEVTAPGFCTRRVSLPGEGDADIVLQEARSVRLVATCGAASGARVVAVFAGAGPDTVAPAAHGTVEGGSIVLQLDALPRVAGHVVVRVGMSVPVAQPIGATDPSVDLGELVLRDGFTLRGAVRSAEPGGGELLVAVRLPAPREWILSPLELDERGRFDLRGLPEVPFDLAIRRPDGALARRRIDPASHDGDLGVLELLEDELEGGTVLLPSPDEEPPVPAGAITLSMDGTTLGTLVPIIALMAGVTIEVDERVETTQVSVNYRETPWRRLIEDWRRGVTAGSRSVLAERCGSSLADVLAPIRIARRDRPSASRSKRAATKRGPARRRRPDGRRRADHRADLLRASARRSSSVTG